jgi:hypothetical protein
MPSMNHQDCLKCGAQGTVTGYVVWNKETPTEGEYMVVKCSHCKRRSRFSMADKMRRDQPGPLRTKF